MFQNNSTPGKKHELISSSSIFLNQNDDSMLIEKNNISINKNLNLSNSDRFVPGSVQKISNSEIKKLSLIDSSKN